jgi:hypothetical protein
MDSLYHQKRRLGAGWAARRNLSLNQLILEELARAAVVRSKEADFSDLMGRWTPDRGFDVILAAQRQIDWDKWK